ncbi:Cenp-O kinetochore centromere component-domain-containing protein [Aspergillus falconensis]
MDLNNPSTRLEEELDSEISSIRREIRKLQRRRRFLASSALSSEAFQKRLKPQQSSVSTLSTLNEDISPLVRAASSHTHLNHHRIAFSTTTFPFKDPSPVIEGESEKDSKKLLGVRIDICVRNGRFTKPYYILLRKMRAAAESTSKDQAEIRLKVHRHTIPAFIPVQRLERILLPDYPRVLGDGDGNGNDSTEQPKKKRTLPARKQNLQLFVREIKRQLVAWHMRLDAIYFIREQIGIIQRGVDTYPDDEEDGPWDRDFLIDVGFDSGIGETRLKKNDYGIASFSPTALEAAYVRVEWEDGRVGRFKISDSGKIERAVVIGDEGRDKVLEAALTGGDRSVLTVLDRLKDAAPGHSDAASNR